MTSSVFFKTCSLRGRDAKCHPGGTVRERLLIPKHDSTISGHSGTRQMYDTMRKSCVWPHMANGVYDYVAWYRSCQRHRYKPWLVNDFYSCFQQGTLENCRDRYLSDPLENKKRQQICSGNDEPLSKVDKGNINKEDDCNGRVTKFRGPLAHPSWYTERLWTDICR